MYIKKCSLVMLFVCLALLLGCSKGKDGIQEINAIVNDKYMSNDKYYVKIEGISKKLMIDNHKLWEDGANCALLASVGETRNDNQVILARDKSETESTALAVL